MSYGAAMLGASMTCWERGILTIDAKSEGAAQAAGERLKSMAERLRDKRRGVQVEEQPETPARHYWGKEVKGAQWFKVFKGERINDLHLSLVERITAKGQP